MEIGNDDIDFIDEELTPESEENTTTQDNDIQNIDEEIEETTEETSSSNEDDFITSLLKDRGIEDSSKIEFENEDGEIEEVSWDSLDNETKLNILNSSTVDHSNDLDDEEIQFINTIRQSQMSPSEYIQYIQQEGVNSYLQNSQTSNYQVDEINDDELFMADFISRTGVTEEEAAEALEKAKQNESLFSKQIGAMRNEYRNAEKEQIQYNELMQQEAAQEQFNQFAEGVRDSIVNFTDFAGCDLNMNNEDMQELYDFITGFDPAGNSYFGKALNDPPTLVRMAWFALNGEQMIQDINEYYKKEIASVRKESYNKGVQSKKDKPNVVYKKQNNSSKSDIYDDLDDF